MEFQFFDPATGKIEVDITRTYSGLDAIFQRIAYTFVSVIGEKLPQTVSAADWVDSEWNSFQTASQEQKKKTVLGWLKEAVSRVKLSDSLYLRPEYESLASLDVDSITIEGDTISILATMTARSGNSAEYTIQG